MANEKTAIGIRDLPTHTIRAIQIQHMRDMGDSTMTITPAKHGYDRFIVDKGFIRRWKPTVRGFVVLKPDGSLAYVAPDVLE